MSKMKVAALVAGLMAAASALQVYAQENIDAGSSAFFGGYSSFGGYYNTFGDYGGYGGKSGFGTYRRVDEGKGSTNATTATFATVPFAGGAETSKHCAWLKGRLEATHDRKWRQRYAACLNDYSNK